MSSYGDTSKHSVPNLFALLFNSIGRPSFPHRLSLGISNSGHNHASEPQKISECNFYTRSIAAAHDTPQHNIPPSPRPHTSPPPNKHLTHTTRARLIRPPISTEKSLRKDEAPIGAFPLEPRVYAARPKSGYRVLFVGDRRGGDLLLLRVGAGVKKLGPGIWKMYMHMMNHALGSCECEIAFVTIIRA